MKSQKFRTAFAPAERSSDTEINNEVKTIATKVFKDENINKVLNAIIDPVLILDKNRQIVYANAVMLNLLGETNLSSIAGLRPGEALHCVHAKENEAGCGTTEFCSTCGAVKAILEAQRGNKEMSECHIARVAAEPLELAVASAPLDIENERYIIFSVLDISGKKRRLTLERIFFHDVLNTAGAAWGLAGMLKDLDPEKAKEVSEKIHFVMGRLIDEIQSQRELTLAENNQLKTDLQETSSLTIINETSEIYRQHNVGKDKTITIDTSSDDIQFSSDPALLRRVIGNLLKNALEATKKEGEVELGCKKVNNSIKFWVHNKTFMPRNIQLQMFNKSFSTKGVGRGTGTYSIKLLTEKYLGGNVSFKSTEKEGTTFTTSFPL